MEYKIAIFLKLAFKLSPPNAITIRTSAIIIYVKKYVIPPSNFNINTIVAYIPPIMAEITVLAICFFVLIIIPNISKTKKSIRKLNPK